MCLARKCIKINNYQGSLPSKAPITEFYGLF